MYLKRLYDKSDPKNPRINGVRVLSLGATPDQHFSPELVLSAIADGWMTMADGKITLKAEDGDVVYNIRRVPGYYCCHDGATIVDAGIRLADGRTVGQKYVADHFPDAASPDPGNPAGYERIHYFDCVEANPRAKE